MEAAYGVNVLKYTETVPSTSATSNPADIIRGLGYWYFYGTDHLGPWTTAAVRYTQDIWLLATSYAVPVLALVAAAFVRWRERAFFLVLLFVGLVLSVGPFPFSHPTAVGGVLKSFMTNTTAGLALRSTDRATPLVLLGLAMLLGSGLTALWSRFHVAGPRHRRSSSPGSWWPTTRRSSTGDTIANNFTQPASLPAYQLAAIKHLNATHPGTRVFAIPGNDFAAYRWGDTVDTPQPAFLDRDFITREQQIMGSIATADTLYAIDGPLQDGTANLERPGAHGPPDGRRRPHGRVRPALRALRGPPAPAAGAPTAADAAGPERPRRPSARRGPTSRWCRRSTSRTSSVPGNVGWPSPARHLHRARPAAHGAGRVGHRRRWSWRATPPGSTTSPGSACSTPTAPSTTRAPWPTSRPGCRAWPPQGAQLVVTDTNRKQAFRWDTLTANAGYTETPSDNPAKTRPERQPGRAVPRHDHHEQVRTPPTSGAVNVTASSYGNSVSYTPEDQAYSAIDNNFDTAWITGTFVPDPAGQWWQAQFANPVTDRPHHPGPAPARRPLALGVAGHPHLRRQGPRHATTCNASSHVTAGQTLTFPTRTFHTAAGHPRRHDERHGAASLGVGRRLLRDRDPRPAGAPGRPDADPDAHQPRRRRRPPTASPS